MPLTLNSATVLLFIDKALFISKCSYDAENYYEECMKKSKFYFMWFLSTIMVLSLPVTFAETVEIPQAKEGKGLVVFYRDNSFKGGAIRFNLNQGQEPIGALNSGTYLYRDVEPGQHTFWSQAISKDSITVDVVAGKTYYIKGVVQMGLLAGRPKLAIVSEAEAKSSIDKLK
jgi:hypothetical protein